MPGFGPAAEALLFRQKDPKPLLPGRGPVRVPSSQAKVKWRTTRLAQTGSPQSGVWPGTQPHPRQGVSPAILVPQLLEGIHFSLDLSRHLLNYLLALINRDFFNRHSVVAVI